MTDVHGNRIHGESGINRTPEYSVWKGVRYRCNNPLNKNFKDYGGRGIKVCERWESYQNFLSDMGRRPSAKHSIDRIDNNGDYCPQNCGWAIMPKQAVNSRKCRLSLEQIEEIRQLAIRGYSCAEIGKHFGITGGHAWQIVKGRRRTAGV